MEVIKMDKKLKKELEMDTKYRNGLEEIHNKIDNVKNYLNLSDDVVEGLLWYSKLLNLIDQDKNNKSPHLIRAIAVNLQQTQNKVRMEIEEIHSIIETLYLPQKGGNEK